MPKLTSFIELYDLIHSLLDLVPCPPEGLPIHRFCHMCVHIYRGFTRCSPGNQSKSGEKRTLKKSYNICTDPKLMHHVTCAQTSRQGGGLSAMFTSRATGLCSILLHRYTRKCEISFALTLSFSTDWRIILSEVFF